MLKLKLFIIGALLAFFHSPCWSQTDKVFRFHLMGEPYTLDPAQIRGTSGSYLFANVYRGLFRYHREKGLIPEGARSCEWKSKLELHCQLSSQKWSNGQDVSADHYVKAFRRLVDPKTRTIQSELLVHLKMAREILTGKAKPEQLGVKALKKGLNQFLIFEFEKPDPEFMYRLISPALTPIYSDKLPDRSQASKMIVNGPYKFKSWQPGRKIELTPNPHYPSTSALRPSVEVLFIDDDVTALRLYEAQRLSFLRRLPSDKIDFYKRNPDFHFVPMARFDYVGFGPSLHNKKDLRKKLSESLKYDELAKILHAKGRPGCPSLPPDYMDKVPCHDFSIPDEKVEDLPPLKVEFSKMGGEDIQKQIEWMQNQWNRNLKVDIQMHSIEQGMYLKRLTTKPADLFRKGVAIDRPTCLAAVEIFTSHHRENYIRLESKTYDTLVAKLAKAKSSQEKRKRCTQTLRYLLDNYHIIPMGEIHFSILIRTSWKGWHLNEMNILDLTDLHWVP